MKSLIIEFHYDYQLPYLLKLTSLPRVCLRVSYYCYKNYRVQNFQNVFAKHVNKNV